MDTISSRESNTNFLPMIAIGAGAIALILAIVALVKLSSVSKELNDLRGLSAQVDSLNSQVGQVGQLNSQIGQLSQAIGTVDGNNRALANQTQTGFNAIRDELTQIKTRLESRGPAHPGGARAGAATPVAGPGEYIVKANDTGVSIARANGVSLDALKAVNPEVNWNRMHVGQRIKLPARAGAQPAQAAAQPAQ